MQIANRRAKADLIYWVDHNSNIVKVAGAWDEFATKNGGCIGANDVVGRNLFDFITGEVTKMYVRTVLDAVRTLKAPRVHQYRCDSPGQKRFMEMRVDCDESPLLVVEHSCVNQEPIAPRLGFRFSKDANSYARCSVCNRLNFNGRWREPDDVTKLLQWGTDLEVLYDLCGDCQI